MPCDGSLGMDVLDCLGQCRCQFGFVSHKECRHRRGTALGSHIAMDKKGFFIPDILVDEGDGKGQCIFHDIKVLLFQRVIHGDGGIIDRRSVFEWTREIMGHIQDSSDLVCIKEFRVTACDLIPKVDTRNDFMGMRVG